MQKNKVLYISHEFHPYNMDTEMAEVLNQLSVSSNSQGYEVRSIMPRFGTINERRHKLHEVVRLSGINITVDREDYPLIIKVASLPNARLQMYFLDNEDLFKRKRVFYDENDKFFEDNAERMIFFCKGAIETIKKFGWPPDVIFIHGWMSALIPLLIKTQYKNEPVFNNTKIVYSATRNTIREKLGASFIKKIINSSALKENQLEVFKGGTNESLILGACKSADVVFLTDEKVHESIKKGVKSSKSKKVLNFNPLEDDIATIIDLYSELTPEE